MRRSMRWSTRARNSSTSAPNPRAPAPTPLTAEQEWTRLEPMLGRLLDRHAPPRDCGRCFSVDTYHPDTARRALALGADMINDVSGLTSAAMIELAGMSGKEWIAMHHVERAGRSEEDSAARSGPAAQR